MDDLLMMTLRAPLFPYDPAIDSPREHLHLMLIYGVVWAVQLGYAVYAFSRWRMLVKERRLRTGAASEAQSGNEGRWLRRVRGFVREEIG